MKETISDGASLVIVIVGIMEENGGDPNLFGISWNPPKSERRLIRDLIIFLEDRRVIFWLATMWDYAIDSVMLIRAELSSLLKSLDDRSYARKPLHRMLTSCHQFLAEVEKEAKLPHHERTGNQYDALDKMQRTFGRQIAVLAAKYGIDLEPHLASLVIRYGSLRKG